MQACAKVYTLWFFCGSATENTDVSRLQLSFRCNISTSIVYHIFKENTSPDMQIFADYPTNFSEVTRKISLGNTAQRLCSAALYTLQCLLQVGENILDIFQTYRNADQSAVNACCFQLFFGQLAVGG